MMHLVYLYILFLLYSATVKASSSELCEGHWEEGDSSEPIDYKGITKRRQDMTLEEMKESVCPIELFAMNCFFLDDTEKANKLARRKWVTSDPNCLEFDGKEFLRAIENKKVYMAGDSTMRQTWVQLVCALHNHTEVVSFANWDMPLSSNPAAERVIRYSCPFGKENCRILQGILVTGSAKFPEYNAEIQLGWHNLYHTGVLQEIKEKLHYSSNDIIIANFGVHYNFGEEQKFLLNLNEFASDLSGLRESSNTPSVFFMQSFPQHFPGVTHRNGYYYRAEAAEWCAPIANGDLTYAAEYDWRNNYAHQILGDKLPIIKIADAMYSQHDAHIGPNLNDLKIADCMHYCEPSGVFHYIHRMIYNTMMNH